ncbi:MAG: glycosyltransferase WbuB, partial [Rhodothermales bacterium]|nr:glycosyltransferase WbuB [Rhodothermales bacterium]
MKHNPRLLLRLAQGFEDDDNVRVVVISEGIGVDWLRQQANDIGLSNLLTFPYQSFEQLPMVLGTGDVLLAVLEDEAGVFSVPSKVLSYFCAGRPLLIAVPPQNLVSKMVVEQDAGIVVNPSDLDGFVGAARALYASAETRESFGRHGREYAEATFAIDNIASEFESVFGRIE